MKGWVWLSTSPQERGDFIRQHQQTLGRDATCQLFRLTLEGERKIRNGDVWHPEYQIDVNYLDDHSVRGDSVSSS